MAESTSTYVRAKEYIKDTAHELLYKVTWPSWEELQSSATLVVVAAIIFSLAIFVMDFVFGANPENNVFSGILYHIYSIFN